MNFRNETGKPDSPAFAWGMTLAYCLFVFMGLSIHEMWRDEYQPWLPSSFSDGFDDFFRNTRMDANPYMWYLMLFGLSKITLNPEFIPYLHISFAIATVYLIARHAPFSRFAKVLIAFGYYFGYEYSLISRGYALSIFFLILFCVLYSRFKRNTPLLSIVVFFLANSTGGFGLLLSISLMIFLVSAHFFDRVPETTQKEPWPRFLLGLGIIFSAIWFGMTSISPPDECVYANRWVLNFDINRLFQILWRVWGGYVPVPSLSDFRFWNTNFLSTGDLKTGTQILLVWLIFAILAFSVLLFSKRIKVLLFFLAGTSGVFLLSYLNDILFIINGVRYNGFFFLVFFVSWWFLKSEPEVSDPVPVLSDLRRVILRVWLRRAFISLLLIAGLVASGIAYARDFVYDFSSIKKTGHYIVENRLHRFDAAGQIDFAVAPLSAYTRKPFYYPERDVISTFPVWTKVNYVTEPNQAFNRLMNFLYEHDDTILVVLSFELGVTDFGGVKFIKQYSNSDCIVPEECFSVYLAVPVFAEEDSSDVLKEE